ncbi:MAG TPA: hypothetical protein VF981_10695 [Gemmatimonadaceae bacterium]|jgi:hypothetical protein
MTDGPAEARPRSLGAMFGASLVLVATACIAPRLVRQGHVIETGNRHIARAILGRLMPLLHGNS